MSESRIDRGPGFDVIGDVHGSGEKLEGLLTRLGYLSSGGAYRHPLRRAVFVGDLIDRGPNQLRVLEAVKAMVDDGAALVVMGNHELNALAYHCADPDTDGEYCRPHTQTNRRQHQAFLDQLSAPQRADWLAWFRTMPLWLDLGELHVVHACWHEPARQLVERVLGGSTFPDLDRQILATRWTGRGDLFRAVETLLKGPEIDLVPYGLPVYIDEDGTPRSKTRLQWWAGPSDQLRDLIEIPNQPGDDGGYPVIDRRVALTDVTEVEDTPVIYGHYWRTWGHGGGGALSWQPRVGRDWTATTACVDFSAVNGGPLVAYRWDEGDTEIRPDRFVAYR